MSEAVQIRQIIAHIWKTIYLAHLTDFRKKNYHKRDEGKSI